MDEFALTVRLRDEARDRVRGQDGHFKTWRRLDTEADILRPVIERMARSYGLTTEETTDA